MNWREYLNEVEPVAVPLGDAGAIPNNPELPLLFYPGVLKLEAADGAAVIECMFADNGWRDSWRNGVFDFPHFHSNAHEALGCYRGSATLRLGGSVGIVREMRRGDVVVLPAGVGHENLGDRDGFAVVGAYPDGQSPDLCRETIGRQAASIRSSIARVPLPVADPVHGRSGPLTRLWRRAG